MPLKTVTIACNSMQSKHIQIFHTFRQSKVFFCFAYSIRKQSYHICICIVPSMQVYTNQPNAGWRRTNVPCNLSFDFAMISMCDFNAIYTDCYVIIMLQLSLMLSSFACDASSASAFSQQPYLMQSIFNLADHNTICLTGCNSLNVTPFVATLITIAQ